MSYLDHASDAAAGHADATLAEAGQDAAAKASPHLARLQEFGFEVRRTVGVSRFGVVYRAYDTTNHRDVAVKVLDLDATRATLGAYSEPEIQALAALRHPHVVPLYSSGQLEPSIRYLVMPWIDGESLRSRLRMEGRLPLVEALRVGVGIADALVAMHARGLIHRDVKPDNVLFDGRHAVLIDFGLVCAAHPANSSAQSHEPLVGTPAYMAPEQWHHDAALDGRADVFGLGALLYESLTSVSPIDEVQLERRTRSAWRWSDTQATESEPSPFATPTRPMVHLRERRSDAPEKLEHLLRRALRLDPKARLSSAAEFRDELEHLLAAQLARGGPSRWLRTRP